MIIGIKHSNDSTSYFTRADSIEEVRQILNTGQPIKIFHFLQNGQSYVYSVQFPSDTDLLIFEDQDAVLPPDW